MDVDAIRDIVKEEIGVVAAPKNDKNLQPIEEIRGMTLLLEMEYADESIRSQGTGFFVAHDKIATNCHVLLGATKVIAKHIEADTTYTIEGIIAFDTENDLVVLKTADKGTSFQLGDSDMVKSGEPICVLGYPKEKECRSDGTLIGFLNRGKRIRFKAPIGPGYSGGPVLNGKREVIAVFCARKNKSGSEGIAIPVNTLKALLVETESAEVESLLAWQKRSDVLTRTVLYKWGRRHKQVVAMLRLTWLVVQSFFYGIRANIKADSGNYSEAIIIYDKIISSKLFPILGTAYAYRGMAKSELGNYQDAIEDANEAIFLDPDSGTGYFSRGHVNLMYAKYKADQGKMRKARSRFQDAISDLTEAIKLNPKMAKYYNLRGWTKYLLGQVETQKGNRKKSKKLFQAAISDADEALQLELKKDKFRSATYHTRGAAKAALSNHDEAIADFNEAIRLRPKKALYYHDRGLSKKALGQQEAAEADFAKAKELDSKSEK